MKKYLLFFVLAITSIAGTVFGQTPATLPYSCTFEAEGNNGWTLKNGTCTNRWYIEKPAGAESRSLYISCNGGITAGYDVDAESVVVAEKLFETGTSDSLTISFDLTIRGQMNYDYLKVFWVPADTNYEASLSGTYYSNDWYKPNTIMSNSGLTNSWVVDLVEGTQTMSVTIANEPNSLKKLVFVWRNDSRHGNQPGAIIDEIQIATGVCDSVTDLVANNITASSAEISWSGSATNYQVRVNGTEEETVTGTSKTLTGLSDGACYKVEVRAVCEDGYSAWASVSFVAPQIPATLPYTCNFDTPGNNGWTLKNGTCANKWYMDTLGYDGALYVSGDGGLSAAYNEDSASVIVAEKLFRTGTSDSLQISFDLAIGGERSFDYLKVFWIPADTNYEATTDHHVYYAEPRYATNVIMSQSSNGFVVNLLSGTQRMTATIANEPGSLKKLTFVWRNDRGSAMQPGAIIDNLKVSGYCPLVTDLAVDSVTVSSAEVSWNGSASSYEVRVNGGEPETITSTSKTLTGLTDGTYYTVEVRAVCADSEIIWDTVTFRTLQTPATLPYSCGFDESGNNGWLIKNGTLSNRWHVGIPTGVENASLYISGDGGTTAGYDTTAASVVIAEKLFQTGTSDSLYISFDLTIGGTYRYSFLKVYWVPADTNYEATGRTLSYYAWSGYTDNVIMSNASDTSWRYVNLLEGTQTMRATIANEPNSLKKLIFMVRVNPNPVIPWNIIIDDIQITTEVCDTITDLTVSNITSSSADVSWNGSATNYQVRVNGRAAETVNTTNKNITGLTQGAENLVEVRAVCENSYSAWTRLKFETQPAILPYTCDFETPGNNGWTLKNGICTNKWYVGTPSGAESASLYISGDGGTTAGYIKGSSVVVAEKLFQTGTSDSLYISFDLTIGGRPSIDYLKVYWVPADTNYEATEMSVTTYYAMQTYTNNLIMNNSSEPLWGFIHLIEGTQRMNATIAMSLTA